MAGALFIKCQEHLDEVRAWARAEGIEDRLDRVLAYVKDYGNATTTRALLYRDFGKETKSFVAEIDRKDDNTAGGWSHWMTMGLIYYEPDRDWGTHT